MSISGANTPFQSGIRSDRTSQNGFQDKRGLEAFKKRDLIDPIRSDDALTDLQSVHLGDGDFPRCAQTLDSVVPGLQHGVKGHATIQLIDQIAALDLAIVQHSTRRKRATG